MRSQLEQLRAMLPRPSGPFRVLAGAEANAAFARARLANRALLGRYEELIGLELVEVHPVLLGGDPETIENKRAVDGETHVHLSSERTLEPVRKTAPLERSSSLRPRACSSSRAEQTAFSGRRLLRRARRPLRQLGRPRQRRCSGRRTTGARFLRGRSAAG
jgi:hypothetical protein